MTLSEVLLWQQLKGKQMLGYDFDRQRPIDEYIVDFCCKDLRDGLTEFRAFLIFSFFFIKEKEEGRRIRANKAAERSAW